ncbi:MAG: RNA polymerase sigma factor [Salibacteraceae bacterium]
MNIEPELLKQCRKNDRKAHNALYKKCFGYLMAICLRYTNNREDAESLLNLAFLKIVSNLDKYKPEVPFGSWINRITVNTIIDQFRRDKKRRENMTNADFQEVDVNAVGVDFNKASEELDAQELETMIQKLPDRSRKVFNLYAIDGYTHKEIGEMLGISDGTSKWHVSFARKTLQGMIKEMMKKMMTITLL